MCLLLAGGLAVQAADTLETTFQKASAALSSGDYAAAEKGFQQVLRYAPNHIGSLGNLGVVYSRTLRNARAIDVYKRALNISPRDPGILLNLGLVYLKQDDYSRALPFFRRLHAIDPRNVQATNLFATCLVYGGQPRTALALLKPLVNSRPDPATLYLLGVAYSRTGQAEAGEQVFAKLLSDASTKAQASFLFGQAYYDSARFEEAEQAYENTLAADPAFPGAHRELGKVYISLRRNQEAEKELNLALRRDPEDSSAMYFLGALYVQTGQYAQAVPYLERVHKLTPDSWAAAFYLGKAKLKLNDLTAAVLLFQQAGELNREEPSIFYLLARALRAAGRDEEAKQALRWVTELHTSALDAERRALRDAKVVGAR
ncbi:MAG TPA: tetratricopeptide repeat protein [Candidatus Acidoferrales bacterium]|nr:tetratricopeptide repeat protein [Candidatus Acidoferrales bacterium]